LLWIGFDAGDALTPTVGIDGIKELRMTPSYVLAVIPLTGIAGNIGEEI